MSRVLLVGKGAPDRGGIPTFLTELRRGPLADDHDITFLNVAHHGTPQGAALTGGNIGRTLRDALAVWRAAKGHDVVHINSALAPAVTVLRAGLLALAGRLRGCAVIVHAHGGNIETWLAGRRARQVMRTAMLPADAVVACWAAGRAALVEALPPERVFLVHNGVDTDRFPQATGDHEPPRILYVGLLTPRKGALDLLEASQMLRAEGLEHELRLLGGTPDEGPAAAAPVLEAAAGSAVLLGTRPPEEMPTAYQEAEIFCLPSWWEAMPLSVLEAMAAGLPVVATSVGDVDQIVDDGTTGLVVPTRSPGELASALRKLLSDADLRASMGAAGRRRVTDRFSGHATAAAISELYRAVRAGR